MKERPIIFSAESVRAILAGQKTQARRLNGLADLNAHGGNLEGMGDMGQLGYRGLDPSDYYRKDKAFFRENPGMCHWFLGQHGGQVNPIPVRCSFGAAGDRLWVREVWGLYDTLPSDGPEGATIGYRASGVDMAPNGRLQLWRSPIHMPRWASRLTLEIVSVRVERLQEISDDDCFAEGIKRYKIPKRDIPIIGGGDLFVPVGPSDFIGCGTPRGAFERSWDHLHGKGAWKANPWVWRIEFRRVGT